MDESHPEFGKTGLVRASVIRVDKIMNLGKGLVSRRLEHLGPMLKAAVKQKLDQLFSI